MLNVIIMNDKYTGLPNNPNVIAVLRCRKYYPQFQVLSLFLFNIYLDDLAKLNNYNNRSFVIVYADDILLIAQSVSELQKLLSACCLLYTSPSPRD